MTRLLQHVDTVNINTELFCCQAVVKQNATAEQLKQRKTLAAAEREENQRSGSFRLIFPVCDCSIFSVFSLAYMYNNMNVH